MPHSIDPYEEWVDKGHPTELHIYENGDHGFGMSNKGTTSDHAAQMTLAIGSGKETGPENEISL